MLANNLQIHPYGDALPEIRYGRASVIWSAGLRSRGARRQRNRSAGLLRPIPDGLGSVLGTDQRQFGFGHGEDTRGRLTSCRRGRLTPRIGKWLEPGSIMFVRVAAAPRSDPTRCRLRDPPSVASCAARQTLPRTSTKLRNHLRASKTPRRDPVL